VRQEEAIDRLVGRGTGDGSDVDVALLRDIGQAMRDASICGLGQTAYNAVETAIVRLGMFR
jgi:NADH-quinone oxidoreductase subunit F